MNIQRIQPSSPSTSVEAGAKPLQRRLSDLHQRLSQETQSGNDARIKAAKEEALLLEIQQATAQMEGVQQSGSPEVEAQPPNRLSTYA